MTTDLDTVIGAMAAAVARARRIADEETVAIAEHYRQHPLLSGMSVPRVRLPEVTLDVPVVVEDYHPGTSGVTATPASINLAARTAIKEAVEEAGVRLPTGVLSGFQSRFSEHVSVAPDPTEARTVYGDAADRVLVQVIEERGLRLEPAALDTLRQKVRTVAEATAVTSAVDPSRLQVSVLTSDVRDAAPQTVARLQFRIQEEGLEWAVIGNEDGSTSHRLVPE